MPDVVMPRLSDSMEEGTILKWMKSVGDEVAVGDELVEIETDKANMVYEAPDAGTLSEIIAEEGATLPIGEVIARVGEGSEAPGGGEGGDSTGSDAAPSGEQGSNGSDAATSPDAAPAPTATSAPEPEPHPHPPPPPPGSRR